MKVNFVIGATASGKSGYAVNLAKKLSTEVVGADSVQIYREFNIGSAKIKAEEMCGVRHHLIDILDPECPFSVMDYQIEAKSAISDIARRCGEVVVCGGTGFYINSLVFELDELPSADAAIRARLECMESEELVDFARAAGMKLEGLDIKNKRRLIRAVEVFELTGKELGSFRSLPHTDIEPVFHYLRAERSFLYERINARVEQMIDSGLVTETESILKKYGASPQALGSIGYRQACEYLNGECNLEVMTENIKQATRNYAKRQETWFRRYLREFPADVNFINI